MKYFLLFFVIVLFDLKGQEKLTLEEAQNLALEKNLGIKITQKQIEVADNQIYRANAGMMPTIDWNVAVNGSFNQVHLKYLDGRNIQQLGNSTSPFTNLSLNWTLYDGKRRFAILDRFKNLGQQSILQNQMQIQNTIFDVSQSYFDLVRLQKSIYYQTIILKHYASRLKLTEERWEIGRGSKLDFLQSKTDHTSQLVILKNLETQFKVSKNKLNLLLNNGSNSNYVVEDFAVLFKNYDLDSLITLSKTKNQELLLLKKNEELNQISLKEANSFLMPKINLTSTLGFSMNKTNVNLLAFNQNAGLNAGITASWRVFDGGIIKHNIQAAKLGNQLIQIEKEQLIKTIENELNIQYAQFELDKTLLKIMVESKKLAEENLDISLEKFRLGASTILELNDAQNRFNAVMTNLVAAQYNVNISELNLLKISGLLTY